MAIQKSLLLLCCMAARFMKSATIYIQIALAAHTHAQIENCIVCVYVYVRGCLIIKINECAMFKMQFACLAVHVTQRLNKIFK